jgi:hypothetical protein
MSEQARYDDDSRPRFSNNFRRVLKCVDWFPQRFRGGTLWQDTSYHRWLESNYGQILRFGKVGW